MSWRTKPPSWSRAGGKSVVVVALLDWNAIHETLYPRSTLANARRLSDSVAQP